jgi:hypothetical protein
LTKLSLLTRPVVRVDQFDLVYACSTHLTIEQIMRHSTRLNRVVLFDFGLLLFMHFDASSPPRSRDVGHVFCAEQQQSINHSSGASHLRLLELHFLLKSLLVVQLGSQSFDFLCKLGSLVSHTRRSLASPLMKIVSITMPLSPQIHVFSLRHLQNSLFKAIRGERARKSELHNLTAIYINLRKTNKVDASF